MAIAIVDYGMGNLRSVYNALDLLGYPADLISDPHELKKFDHVILPGVGSFRICMENLKKSGFDHSIIEYVQTGKPLMGICLGMQILASKGYEDGETSGLGLIPGEIKKIIPTDKTIKIPHVGWNDVTFKLSEKHPLANKIKNSQVFYFTHSFYFDCMKSDYSVGETLYGSLFTSAVLNNNVFATQFHPEKSQDAGLKLFHNFIKWNP